MTQVKMKIENGEYFIMNNKGWNKTTKEVFEQLKDGAEVVEGNTTQEVLKYHCYRHPETLNRMVKTSHDGKGEDISGSKSIDEIVSILEKRADGRKFEFNRLSYYESQVE